MKKFLKSLVAVALATTTLASVDLEGSIDGGLYSFSRTRDLSWKTVDGETTTTNVEKYSATSAFNNFSLRVTGLYCATESFYIGLSSGVGMETAFADKFDVQKKGETKLTEQTVAAADQMGTAWYTIPVKATFKYDFNDVLLSDSNLYATLRGGIVIALKANEKDLVTPGKTEKHTINWQNWAIDAGLGAEYMGAQLEVFYAGKWIGTTAPTGETFVNEAEDITTEEKTEATSAYGNHSVNVSLGYRLKDLL